jgi:hypothetical protein
MSDVYNTPPRIGNQGGPAAKPASVADQARNLGQEIKNQATGLTQSATEAVKTQASALADSAKEIASDAGDKLRTTVTEQKTAGADYVGTIAGIVRRTSYEFDQEIPQAGRYIRKAADQIDNVSQAIRNRDMSELVGEVQDFARKQPTAFFGAAVLLGFAAVRFLKSSSGTSKSSNPSGGGGGGGSQSFGQTRTAQSNPSHSSASSGMRPR